MHGITLVEQWYLWFMIYSFIGWVYESILCSVLEKKVINRGFLNGPVCPIYGAGAVLVLLVLTPLRNQPLILFLVSAVLTTTLEYITSWAMEKLFHARWWDYSKHRVNIHGRVCLIGFVAFGAMAVLVVKYVHPWISVLTGLFTGTWLHVICAILLCLMATDIVLTLTTVLGLDKRLAAMRQRVEGYLPRGLHRFQLRRLSKAFPRLVFTRYHEEWQLLKARMRERFER